jgi:Uma2 family endonuclease
MGVARAQRLSPQEYLAIERKAAFKSEYYAGEMFAMAGASARHTRIVNNLVRVAGNQFVGRPCQTFSSDLRVRIPSTGLYTYPDFIALCEVPQYDDSELDTLLNSKVIIEVLSPSTEDYDRHEKFAHYRSAESLAEYLLIAQDRIWIDHYVRQPDGKWPVSQYNDPAATILLASIDVRLLVSDVYDKVTLDPPGRTRPHYVIVDSP